MGRRLVAGGVYAIRRAGDCYGVAKVVIRHPARRLLTIRVYCGQWEERPQPDWEVFRRREPGDLEEMLEVFLPAEVVTTATFAFWEPELLFVQEPYEAAGCADWTGPNPSPSSRGRYYC